MKPRVYFHLEGTRKLGSSRVRGWDLAERMREEAEIVAKGGPDRIVPHGALWRSRFLYFQKTTQVSDYALRQAARATGARRLAFDLDDVKHVSNRDERVARKAKLFQDLMLRSADVVTVASGDALRYCREHARDVRLVRTPVDVAKYRPKVYGADTPERITVGWLGNGRAYGEDLKMVAPTLAALAAKHPIRFRVVGALANPVIAETFRPLARLGIEVELVDEIDWAKPGATGEAIREFDVGVYPLRDNAFNRQKGGFKLLEYMASAVPAIASPVSETAAILDEGAPALRAATPDEWTAGLDRLLSSPDERRRLGEAGRAYAERHHGYEKFHREMRRAILGD